jgi:anti-sigma factor RsiW
MKNDCTKWRDPLVEAALTGRAAAGLEDHLSKCVNCEEELRALRARRERLDALLPHLAQGAEPSPGFRARVLARAEAANEARHERPWRAWALAGAISVTLGTLIIGVAFDRRAVRTLPEPELSAAQKLAEWRAPSDVLLKTPGREILQTMPKIGESYLQVPLKTEEE